MRYKIDGEPLPVVTCELQAGEQMITEGGSMAWMTPNMQMETTSGGGAGKVLGRMFSGESIFLNRYTAQGGQGSITFASSLPGSIMPFEIRPGREVVVQKAGFLAAESGVDLSIHFQRRLGAGFFGGEGFIMQRLSGSGMAFIEIDGHAMEYDLQPGEQLIIDTGYLAACDVTVDINIVQVKGVKNILFGGEGLFHTVLTGPGHVILQSQPLVKFAALVRKLVPSSN